MSQYRPQYAQMEILSIDSEGPEALMRCSCGEVFRTNVDTRLNVTDTSQSKCPSCFSLCGTQKNHGIQP